MCTLIAAVRAFPSFPLVVAANRDERTLRPASPPFLWPPRDGTRILAPRDEEAHGTWLGINHRGLFVGITNRAFTAVDPSRRSRGALVLSALAARSASELAAELSRTELGVYNPFHLFYADREAAWLTVFDGEAVRHEPLQAGLHVITERSVGEELPARVALIRARWREIEREQEPEIPSLAALLAQHAEDPFAGTCVHADARGYGTRSSLILLLGHTFSTTRMLWAEGRPCVTPFADQGAWIERLGGEG